MYTNNEVKAGLAKHDEELRNELSEFNDELQELTCNELLNVSQKLSIQIEFLHLTIEGLEAKKLHRSSSP